jgi:hypothetical protein
VTIDRVRLSDASKTGGISELFRALAGKEKSKSYPGDHSEKEESGEDGVG